MEQERAHIVGGPHPPQRLAKAGETKSKRKPGGVKGLMTVETIELDEREGPLLLSVIAW